MSYNLNDPRIQEMAEQAKKGFTLLPEGKYLMRCASVEFAVINGKNGPTDAMKLNLEVDRGEPHEMETCRDTLFFSEKALGRVLLCLSAFGLKEGELANFEPSDAKHQNLVVGRKAIVTVKHSKPDEKNRIYANVDYAGYATAHPGSVEEMRRERGAAPAGGSEPAGLQPLPF